MSEEILTSTFTTMRNKLLRIAERWFPNKDDADDALQDAFCRLWARKDEIKSTGEAEALTVTTIRNMGIDNHRKRKIETCSIEENKDSIEEDNGEKDEIFDEVEKIIEEELTPLQKEILRRKEYDGESIEAIARSLDMQPPAVRMQLSRARKKIKECYQKRAEI